MPTLRVHDLVRLSPGTPVAWDKATAQPSCPPEPTWAVVRRQRAPVSAVCIGVRGTTRSQRHAGSVAATAVAEVVTPEQLLWRSPSRDLPVFQALRRLRERWNDCIWGPTGSVGYELATGLAECTTASDLDLCLRCAAPPSQARLKSMWSLMQDLPCSVDALLETPYGAVALEDLLRQGHKGPRADARCLLRTADGPCLVRDPWQQPERNLSRLFKPEQREQASHE